MTLYYITVRDGLYIAEVAVRAESLEAAKAKAETLSPFKKGSS